MNKRILLMVGAMVIVSMACSLELPSFTPKTLTGSGNLVTKEETITDFNKVDISHAFKVKITQAEKFSVIIRVDDNMVEHLRVDKQGDTLRIGLKPNINLSVNNATLEAEVGMPELTGLDLSGASNITVTGFKSNEALTVDVSGSSSLQGDIEAGDANFDASGSSDVSLTGTASGLMINVSGASSLDLGGFPGENGNIEASGASKVTVNLSGQLNIDASGASNVYYLGSPTLGTIDISGASTVDPK